jgi:hypothetical protein
MSRRTAAFTFEEKSLRFFKAVRYDAGLFGRDDKRQEETEEACGRLAQLVERIPYKD